MFRSKRHPSIYNPLENSIFTLGNRQLGSAIGGNWAIGVKGQLGSGNWGQALVMAIHKIEVFNSAIQSASF
jgi:hypothetical protein